MNAFVAQAVKASNKTTTTNGMKANRTTLNANLDFFGKSGNITYPGLIADFKNAYAENSELALRNILQMRDIRGGKGVRDNFRTVLTHLLSSAPSVFEQTRLIALIPEVGRWDDLFVLVTKEHTDVANAVVKFIATELSKDIPNSLLCKWLPRKGIVASKLRSYLKWTPKQYRQVCVKFKNVVETKMCNKDWSAITYSHVPSKAIRLYSKAFIKQDAERYAKFMEKVATGEEKINASTLYPHEVIGNGRSISATQEAQWNALPNFMPERVSILPLVDVSGSMECPAYGNYSCMTIAIAMGLYLADKAKSNFRDTFITFSSSPELVSLAGRKTLEAKHSAMKQSTWGMSTNIEKAFDLVLKHALKNNVQESDMPSAILILSDMQFNGCVQGSGALKLLKTKYEEAGYQIPKVIFWNLSAAYANTPVTFDSSGAALVSGFSPSALTAIFNNDFDKFTPENIMLSTLNVPRYDLHSAE